MICVFDMEVFNLINVGQYHPKLSRNWQNLISFIETVGTWNFGLTLVVE